MALECERNPMRGVALAEAGYNSANRQDMRPKIRARNLRCVFRTREGGNVALQDLSFDVPAAAFFCVLGPSGCGKSTLLRLIAGLQQPSGGVLDIEKEGGERPITAMIFQDQQSVLPWMSVRDNIEYGLAMRGVPRKDRRKISDLWLLRTGLKDRAGYFPAQLSGGMRQRVNVARAFAADPEILLMDEPFASLDQQNKALLQEELLTLWEGTQKTVLYVTHDIDEAIALGDVVLVMSAAPGRVKEVFESRFARPRNLAVIRMDQEFRRMAFEIGGMIREEVLQARK